MADRLPGTETTAQWPPITCLCPTYGRFERLRDAIACFMSQDYPGEKRLLILNDAPQPLRLAPGRPLEGWGVRIVNRPMRFETLGRKRQALLEMARTPLVAHWDDDDLYLPWHLTECVRTLRANQGAACVKARSAWWCVGPREAPRLVGVRRNVFEGQMVFDRAAALRLGGYPSLDSGQAKALLDAFRRAGLLYEWDPPRSRLSYVYRWADGIGHVSAPARSPDGASAFAARNHDFGVGRPLIPRPDLTTWAADRLASVVFPPSLPYAARL